MYVFIVYFILGFPGGSDSKESTCNVGDLGSIPGSGRSPGEGNGNPLQYSCLRNPMDRGARWATVHGVAKSRTRLTTEHTRAVCSIEGQMESVQKSTIFKAGSLVEVKGDNIQMYKREG